MEDTEFWRLVERAKLRAGAQVYARNFTWRDELNALDDSTLHAFHERFLQAHRQAYRADLAAACSLAMGTDSDDAFERFRNWLISDGEKTFTEVLANPDRLAGIHQVRQSADEAGELTFVASDLLMARGVETDFPCTGEALNGNPVPPDQYAERFPKLFAKRYGR